MYEFNSTEKEFLKRFSGTGNGKEFAAILKSIASKVDKTSNIPTGSDYGAQVEGRKLVSEMIYKLLKEMDKKQVINRLKEEGIDEYF